MDNNRRADNRERLNDRILKFTGLFGGIQVLVILVSLVRTRLITGFLKTVGFGINENLNRTLNLMKSSTNLGIAYSAVHSLSVDFEKTEALQEYTQESLQKAQAELESTIMVTRSWAFLTALLGFALTFLLAPWLGRWAFGGNDSYAMYFRVLSIAVAAAAINGGEMAVMKGTGMIRQIAVCQLLAGVVTLVLSVPLFAWLGLRGIVPSMTVVALVTTAISLFYTLGRYRYSIRPFRLEVLKKGTEMVRFGIFFTLAAFFEAGALSIIANFITNYADEDITGKYSAALLLITYFNTFLFAAMDADYFPRLSAVSNSQLKTSLLVNRQVQAMSMIAGPLVIAFMVFLPIVVWVILSNRFADSIPMAQLAVLSILAKSLTLPVAYLALSRADSLVYIVQEFAYNAFLVMLVMAGFKTGGLVAVGAAFAVTELLYMAVLLCLVKFKYGVGLSKACVKGFATQFLLALLASICCIMFGSSHSYMLLAVAFLFFCVSSFISFRYLSRNTSLFKRLGSIVS